uniref:Uncharacterized protein n=1 Tax=Haptolina brevifila TaxID=156173 RepID=A0A7S2H8H0_9EUKA|eukprot:CAMPEP_0174719570 /NCGR_PEP_ID=MMETSP1094-20130205/31421_1 /TAXON_ID=156173 /ORGANISM="Chrysochromulina brevifilum, Strain UTEX LB 985" /LENGTH=188 /DNA_ID=CAMNT_0015919891 /DNA_START=39 /DNA_END=605 /DNA_ORIENTATION=+
MGIVISKTLSLLSFRQKTRILMLGLDAAGKTTVLYRLKIGELVMTVPSIGFNVEQITYKNVDMTIWDVGGQDRIRALWRHYYKDTNALIWIVDSADHYRLAEAREELHRTLSDDLLRDVSVLVMANKQDLQSAMKTSAIADGLGLASLHQQHSWYIQGCCAVTGDGIFEGLNWLHRSLQEKRYATRAG